MYEESKYCRIVSDSYRRLTCGSLFRYTCDKGGWGEILLVSLRLIHPVNPVRLTR
jgi:hypothetical protein